ncbi:methyltransferase, UbiE/COQ5 family [Synechococcus sp. PCC 7335]|uniref:class I SAM-dependent methyltransferase n=1 Tax=Synechococcus sp. (strain ATCC 29403 / PCC 7335) TaxID=91464 RepID=UPI00017EC838|nr:class I SAM-dependent methyltransferase [Synechococcus sp. PCC 7335]EDX82345.1 methyltransferase, UbiE/COQ5 family [Synechococcus sp. PCC 7335]
MSQYKQHVIDCFNRRTAYDSEGAMHPYEANKIIDFAPDIRDGQTVLDLATGTGLVAILAAKQAAPSGSVIGVDISAGMLSQAKRKTESLEIGNLEFVEADIESINFEPERFDVIFCCSAIMYVGDIPALLNKCRDWLRPGGYIVFSTSAITAYRADIQMKVYRDLFDVEFPHILAPLGTPGKCKRMLEQANFLDIEIERDRQGEYLRQGEYSVDVQWAEDHVSPHADSLMKLATTQREELQSAYQQATSELMTAKGFWSDRSLLFVKARKEV